MSGIGQRDIIPPTKEPALFNVAEPGGYPLGAEPPATSDGLVYNTDDASPLERFGIRENYRDQAIENWAKGWERGDYITHRILGHAVEIKGDRAINKMKVTISWRFAGEDGVEWDADKYVRFVFLKKQLQGWQILCNHPIYEKDKCVPVDPTRPPNIAHDSLAQEPKGYMFLAYGMRRLGYPIKQNLPQLFGREPDKLYKEIVEWLDGKDIDFSKDEF